MNIKASVVGAAGFAGIELVRLLVRHPDFQLVSVTSDALAGTRGRAGVSRLSRA